jgi:putative restriction endonuclease
MRGFVANTDYDWYRYLHAIAPPIDEVNFWKPGSESVFKALRPGEPFFFKLKAPHNAICGFGVFALFSVLPVSLAWQVYGPANGASSYGDMRSRLERIRARFDMAVDPKKDFRIGCILVNQTVFFDESDWVPMPADFAPNIVQGKGYDLTRGEGERIWLECLARATDGRDLSVAETPAASLILPGGYGSPALIRPRLGQRSFRIAVLDSYGRRCAITGERTLPALEAAHIREYAEVAEHSVNNGILFRADVHKLFDAGYVTVAPDLHFLVSRRIREDFENGRDYYALHGTPIRLPNNPADRPHEEALWWHREERFLG